jgi:16S rRNA G966 N2-methylase RsmD
MRESPDLKQGRYFKHWAQPGPVPPGAAELHVPVEPGETLDAISGGYRIFQFKKGHRFSTDDVLTAFYGTSLCPRAERVLDLGSGIGSVGMIAAWRLPGACFVTIEAQDESVRLARKSARYNGLESRYEIRHGDFRDAGVLRVDERFDLVLGSPPYFPLGGGHGDHPQKVACRFQTQGGISDYCRVAPRTGLGRMVRMRFPSNNWSASKVTPNRPGLHGVRRRPVVLKQGAAPCCLFAMIRADHLPPALREQTWIEPALIIRTKRKVHPEYGVETGDWISAVTPRRAPASEREVRSGDRERRHASHSDAPRKERRNRSCFSHDPFALRLPLSRRLCGNASELIRCFIEGPARFSPFNLDDRSFPRAPELIDSFDAPKRALLRGPDGFVAHENVDGICVELREVSERDPRLPELNSEI